MASSRTPEPPHDRWALAQRIAVELTTGGSAYAVAAVGSVARGDSTAGSDIDLWALGPTPGVSQRVVEGVPVTVMTQHPDAARDLHYLAMIETDTARVLSDPRGRFATLLAFARSQRGALRSVFEDTVVLGALRLLRSARAARHPATALLARREALRCVLQLWAYRHLNLKAPKLRHLEAHLSAPRAMAVRRLLGLLPPRAELHALQQQLPSLPGAIQRALRRRGVTEEQLPPPWGALAMLSRGDAGEGLLKLRKYLDESLVDPLLQVCGRADLTELVRRELPPSLRHLWNRAHDLPASAPSLRARNRALVEGLRELVGELELERAFSIGHFLGP